MAKFDKSVPRTGLYKATTLDGTVICENITSLEKCEKIVRKYQKTNNTLVKVYVEIPQCQHLKLVDPISQP